MIILIKNYHMDHRERRKLLYYKEKSELNMKMKRKKRNNAEALLLLVLITLDRASLYASQKEDGREAW